MTYAERIRRMHDAAADEERDDARRWAEHSRLHVHEQFERGGWVPADIWDPRFWMIAVPLPWRPDWRLEERGDWVEALRHLLFADGWHHCQVGAGPNGVWAELAVLRDPLVAETVDGEEIPVRASPGDDLDALVIGIADDGCWKYDTFGRTFVPAGRIRQVRLPLRARSLDPLPDVKA